MQRRGGGGGRGGERSVTQDSSRCTYNIHDNGHGTLLRLVLSHVGSRVDACIVVHMQELRVDNSSEDRSWLLIALHSPVHTKFANYHGLDQRRLTSEVHWSTGRSAPSNDRKLNGSFTTWICSLPLIPCDLRISRTKVFPELNLFPQFQLKLLTIGRRDSDIDATLQGTHGESDTHRHSLSLHNTVGRFSKPKRDIC
jgi:hypothetical protein